MKITIVSGARPNFMKIAPLCRAIDAAREAGKNISYRIVYTGPQDDTTLDASLFSDLAMRKPDAYLGISGRDHSQVAAAIMLAFERELDELKLGFCKVHAAFPQGMDDAALAGLNIMQAVRTGSLVTLVVRGNSAEASDYLLRQGAVFAEGVPLTLEEVFIHEMEAVGYDYNNILF